MSHEKKNKLRLGHLRARGNIWGGSNHRPLFWSVENNYSSCITVLPAAFLVSVFCWYQICWAFGISVGIVPPFFVSFPPFFLKRGAELLKKGAIAPLLRKKGGNRPLFDTELYRPRYRYGKYQEIPTDTDKKIPI